MAVACTIMTTGVVAVQAVSAAKVGGGVFMIINFFQIAKTAVLVSPNLNYQIKSFLTIVSTLTK